jgi:hypothetical protein
MARFYGCMASGGSLDGVEILKPETTTLGRAEQSRFMDPYIADAMAFGVCWALLTPQGRFGPAPDAFGHSAPAAPSMAAGQPRASASPTS